MKARILRSGRTLRIHFARQWWLQALVLLVIWGLCEVLVRALRLPIPGGIIGMGLLLVALELRIISVRWFRRGASRLLGHLILFLIPAMLAVVNHHELASFTGLKLLAAVLIGTPLVMIGTAAVVEAGFRLRPCRES